MFIQNTCVIVSRKSLEDRYTYKFAAYLIVIQHIVLGKNIKFYKQFIKYSNLSRNV